MLRTLVKRLLVLLVAASLVGCAKPPTATPIPYEPVPGSTPLPTSISADSAVFSVAPEPDLPAGVAVVYRDTAGLWAIEGATAPRLLFSGGVSDWRVAPDRSGLAVLAPTADGVSLLVMDWRTGETLAVVSPSDLQSDLGAPGATREVAAVEWLPDSSALLIGSGVPGEMFAAVADDLQRLDVADGSLVPLLVPGAGGVPLPSPDGSWVSLTRPALGDENAVISVTGPDGAGRSDLMEHPAIRTDERLADVRLPTWSPDSSALHLVLPGRDDTGRPWMGSEHSEIIRIPVDGTELGRSELPVSGHASARGVSWSPDGSSIAYTRPATSDSAKEASGGADSTASEGADESTEDLELVMSSWDGGDEVVYATHPALQFLAWAPDSDHFLYESDGSLYLGRRGEPPASFGDLGGNAVRTAAVIDPGHVVLLAHELVMRTPDGVDSSLASDVGRFEVLLP